MKALLALLLCIISLFQKSLSSNNPSVTDEYIPENCEVIAEPGDQLLVGYDVMLSNGNRGVSLEPPEQLFAIALESSDSPVHSAIKGMCQNSTRKITWSEVDSVNMHPIPQPNSLWEGYEMGGVSLTIMVDRITKPDDFAIFTAMRDDDMPRVLDLIEAKKGINAVDQFGMSPVSASGIVNAEAYMCNTYLRRIVSSYLTSTYLVYTC
jgi:hypothetical protein